MNTKRKVALAASGLLAFTGIILVSNQANATNPVPTPVPTISSPTSPTVNGAPSVSVGLGADETGTNAVDGDNVQSGDQSGSDVTDSTDATDATDNAADGDNVQSGDVQSGDQSGSDVTGASTPDAESNN
jgi:hypothetical protein